MIDGVIKYTHRFKSHDLPKVELFKHIEFVRERLFALKLIGESCGVGYGNISCRVDKDTFIITGTQTGDMPNLNAENYALVEKCDESSFFISSSGVAKPSSESFTHKTLYNLDPQINTIIHIHNNTIWNHMLKNRYLVTGDVEYGTKEMASETERIYKDIDPLTDPKFVMSAHKDGAFFFGKSSQDAELALLEVIGEISI